MKDLLERLGIVELNQGALVGLDRLDCRGKTLESISPIDGRTLAKIRQADPAGYEEVVASSRSRLSTNGGMSRPRGAARWSGRLAMPSASGKKISGR